MDKTHFSVVSRFDTTDEKEYWLTKTSEERLQAMELMRQIIYGYHPLTTKLQRVFTVAQFSPS